MPRTREQLAERAAQELQDGFYVNLGIGIPTLVANYIPEGMSVHVDVDSRFTSNPSVMLGAALLALLALTSVVALQAVGVILVVAMLIIPGATAYLLTNKFGTMLIIAPTMSATRSM